MGRNQPENEDVRHQGSLHKFLCIDFSHEDTKARRRKYSYRNPSYQNNRTLICYANTQIRGIFMDTQWVKE